MSCCLDPLTRRVSVEGEMDRLRILTTDLGSIPNIEYGHIKTEPISCHASQIITIKQELPTATQFFVKSEIHDTPQYTPDEQKHCISMPSATPPTPTEDTSDKVLVGSTSRFLPSVSTSHGPVYECVVYVKGDTTMLNRVEFFMNQEYHDQLTHIRSSAPFEISEKCTKEKVVKVRLHFKDKNIPTQVVQPVRFDRSKSGFICQGPETAVELPTDVTEAMRVAEIAKWLETDQIEATKMEATHSLHNRQVVFQNNMITSDTMLSGTLQWTKSAPSSPLSPASSPGDNRITRSASSSPIRQQTVLPNPCCRLQKPITQPVLTHEPILSARSAVDGEPLAKRRPAPIASMNISSINHRFTPISLPESPTLMGSQTTIPMERITAENLSSVQEGVHIGMLAESLPTGTITLGDQPSSQIFVASPSTKVQHILLNRDVQSLHNGPIKQEFFVRNEPNHSLDTGPTEITLGTATVTAAQTTNITQSDNEHLRNQRTGRKCRKVYGVNNRHLWCTACRWKKACRRFPS